MAFFALPGLSTVAAEEETFYCEVLSVEGTVLLSNSEVYGKPVQEGDLLKKDDEIETGANSSADLAFDKDWSNVTRVEEKSRLKVKAVFPTRLYLDQGALYAKLKSIPKDSTFQVETPTAIAAVRGTEYRTEYADGETLISNDSEAETSQVYLYEADADGQLRGEPVALQRTQFTGVAFGGKPRPPRPMDEIQKQRCQKARGVLDHRIREQVARGRVAKIQDVRSMEAFGRRMKEQQAAERGTKERRMEERREAGGPLDPPGGPQGSGFDRRGGSPMDGPRDRRDAQADNLQRREGSPFTSMEGGRKPENRYRFRDPGPQQDESPPGNQLPGRDVRPAPIHEGGFGERKQAFDRSAAHQKLHRQEPQFQPMRKDTGLSANKPQNKNPRPASRPAPKRP